MNQKGFVSVVTIIVIVVVALGGYFVIQKYIKTDTSDTDMVPSGIIPTPTPTLNTKPTPDIELPIIELPITENDVIDQPAYLTDVYLKDGKRYIDVDYVDWLHGEDSIEAKIEDGECFKDGECSAFPNGHKRNRNDKIRTFEVASPVLINVNGSIASTLKIGATNVSISFEKFMETVFDISPITVFITIDVENNIVVKINEPYQE